MISAGGFAEHHQTTIYYAELDPAAARLTHVGTSKRSSETDRTPHNPKLCITPAEDQRPDRALRRVVVYLDAPVFAIAYECMLVPQRVSDRLRQPELRRYL